MNAGKVCVLVSGGLDSCVLLALMTKIFHEVHPVYIRFGLAWENAELHWLRKFLKAIQRPSLKPLRILQASVKEIYGDHWSLSRRRVPDLKSRDESVYLPGRNLLLLSHAAAYCIVRNVPGIVLGVLKGNPFSDSRAGFFRAFEAAIASAYTVRIQIHTPFSHLKKPDVVRLAEGIPVELTFSCLSPAGVKPCGSCNKCGERNKALSRFRRGRSVPPERRRTRLTKRRRH